MDKNFGKDIDDRVNAKLRAAQEERAAVATSAPVRDDSADAVEGSDYQPLDQYEIEDLLRRDKETHPRAYPPGAREKKINAIKERLYSGIVGISVARPTTGRIAEKMAEISDLYDSRDLTPDLFNLAGLIHFVMTSE